MTRALVTGGTGFIGSHVVDRLIEKGWKVIVLDNLSGGYKRNLNPNAKFVRGDIRNRRDCERSVKEVDAIFHLAAHAAESQSIFTPIYNAEVDYIGFVNLLVASINEGVPLFIFTSSMAVYGRQPQLPMREDQPRRPEDPYGVCKAACERLLEIYGEVFDFDYVILRPHNVYGPKQNLADPYRNVIAIWMNRILNGKPPIIYGDGEQTRAFTYIDDCAPWIAKAAEVKEAYGETINIGSEEVVTINQLCRIVLEKMGSSLEPVYRPARPLEVRHAWCSNDKARRILGYETSVPLEIGIERMGEWAKSLGPQAFSYWEEFEIRKRVPRVWRYKEL